MITPPFLYQRPKSAIHQIIIIATTHNSQKAFQDGMAVVWSSGMA